MKYATMPSHCASRPFPKLPSSLLPDARLPPATLTHARAHTNPSECPHTYAVERWDFHTGRQANSQTNTHMYTTCPTKGFPPPSFLSRLNKQTLLSRSLYSCADFCVSVCFNLNGFQVPSLPKPTSLFSPLIRQLTLKLSSSPAALSLFFSLSLNPQETSQSVIYHSLLFAPVSPFAPHHPLHS